MNDTWTMVEEARVDLVRYLETLTPEQWDAPSLCDRWKVRDVVGHLIQGSNKSAIGKGVMTFARNGFNMNKSIAASASEEGKHSPDALLKAMRQTVPMRNMFPGTNVEDRLYDTVVHTQDIRRATGLPGSVPEARLRVALDRLKNVGSILGTKKRIAGLTLVATDMDWTHGHGPEVRGTGEALLMTMAGRTVALDDLTGDGVAMLRSRR
jgi:uncharacterized protein (TIGR03083 family)